MIISFLAWAALVLAAIPAALFLSNLLYYRRLPARRPGDRPGKGVSVLIPARNEAGNIGATLAAVLGSRGVEFEVIVLDDHSTDGTGELVAALAATEARLRLVPAPALPAGWCGKPHACQRLAELARYPTLLFLDADVRLAPDALARLVARRERTGVALLSGVPRQEVVTVSERWLLPLIHFVLLGYLPMWVMRRTRRPAFSAGCGQLFVAGREEYFLAGGHAAIRSTLHDGVKLPRRFRQAGFSTDLCDATDLAVCRMYSSNAATWSGLGKNATEGLGAPGTIGPMSVLLLGGQVLPFLLLLVLLAAGDTVPGVLWGAVVLAWLPRMVAAARFRQPWDGALAHPLGVLALMAIQWLALLRHWAGRPAQWKGRSYGAVPGPVTPVNAA